MRLGEGSSAQTLLSQVPYEIDLDRIYMHGDPLYGQKRGIALNGRSVTIRNSYISDIKAVGFDTQAIGGWNGPGPFTIENNYLEGAGENVILGGSDPPIPDLVTENVVVRYNYMSKPWSWRDPIIATPAGVSAAAAVGGGTLEPGTYTYRVVARRPVGGGTIGRSTASAEVTATLGAMGGVTITWTRGADRDGVSRVRARRAVLDGDGHHVHRYGTSPDGRARSRRMRAMCGRSRTCSS